MKRELWEAIAKPEQRQLLMKLLVIYLIVALPFKALDILPDLANIRPNSAFIPIYGYLFGPVGAWANALGNFLYDLLTGSFTKSSMAGTLANFCVPLLMTGLWHSWVGPRFCLEGVKDLGWYVLIAVIGAVAKACIITPAVVFFYPDVGGTAFAQVVVATEITFYLVPAIAILIVLHGMYGYKAYITDEASYDREPLKFVPLSLEHQVPVERILVKTASLSCQYSFASLYAYRQKYGTQICLTAEGTLFIRQIWRKVDNKVAYFLPLNAADMPAAIRRMERTAEKEGHSFFLFGLTKVEADSLRVLLPVSVATDRDWTEYLYDCRDMAAMDKAELGKLRRDIQRFWRCYGHMVTMSPVSIQDLPQLREFHARWCQDYVREQKLPESLATESEAIYDCLNNFEVLGLSGLIARDGATVIGYALGTVLPGEAFDVMFMKTTRSYSQMNKALIHELSRRHVAAMLNLEEDLGLPGLRQSKLQLQPAMLLDKYTAVREKQPLSLNRLQANLCLLTVVLCWAFEVIILKNIPDSVPGLAVTSLTNLIGGIVLTIIFFRQIRKFFTKKLCWLMLPLPVLNIAYNLLRFEATRYLPAHVTEYASTAVIVVLPLILLLVWHEKQPLNVWGGGALIVIGIICSLDWTFPMGQAYGLVLMFAFSFIFSIYVIVLNKVSKQQDTIAMAVCLLNMVGLISLVAWLILLPQTVLRIDYSGRFWASLFSDAYFVCIFATVLNILIQKFVSPLDAVAIYSLGPAIVLIMSVVLPPQLAVAYELNTVAVVSCIIIVVGSILCQMDWSSLTKKNT